MIGIAHHTCGSTMFFFVSVGFFIIKYVIMPAAMYEHVFQKCDDPPKYVSVILLQQAQMYTLCHVVLCQSIQCAAYVF